MAASSADDHLTVGGDANVVVIESRCDAAGPSLRDPDHRIVDRRTQYMPLSATINNPTSIEGVDGTFQHRSACVDDKLSELVMNTAVFKLNRVEF